MENQTILNKVIIAPLAYIKSLMYFQRFSNEFMDEKEYKFAYGLLLGFFNEQGSVCIDDFVPIKEFEKEYLRFKKFDKIFEYVNQLNNRYNNDEFPLYIMGWARNSIYNDINPNIIDKENHLFFQTAIEPKSILWIFNIDNLTIDDGFKIYTFKGDFKTINISSELIEIKYEFSKEIYFDELVQIAIDIEKKRKNSEIIIKGIEGD
ncbi:MAG: hypothetical protein ACTSQJ_12915 [Promethearchaeota archaeon]